MKKLKLNDNWTVFSNSLSPLMARLNGNQDEIQKVNLPYDAMIHEKRRPDAPAGAQNGFYPGGCYNYVKTLSVPEDWKSKRAVLEFEGVYRNAKVYVNGDYAGGYPGGYTNFYVELDHFLRYGEENEIRVFAENSSQPNSRWYSGSGIYRDVNLYLGNPIHIDLNGVQIRTPEADEKSAVVLVDLTIVNEGRQNKKLMIQTKLAEEGETAAEESETAAGESRTAAGEERTVLTAYGSEKVKLRQRIQIKNPTLWDCDSPSLYQCQITVSEQETGELFDRETICFGIRTLSLDAENGLRINGKEVKLRGACIHHDNGVIGAATLKDAEERRCRQLKEAGFNSIRSAHHPMSKAMLEACDKHGMLVMDELADMWNHPKNTCDYAQIFDEYWERDIERMVEKDFNHPSVILYSLGNEIPEAGTPWGGRLNRLISQKVKSLDDTRYTTNAINGMLAAAPRIGEILADLTGMNQEEMKNSFFGKKEKDERPSEEGSNGLNNALALLSGPMGDAFCSHPVMTGLIEEFAAATDVAGYNYMTGRHELEHALHPNRIVLGAETFPGEIVRLWDIVRRNAHVIGDMTWTGYDYLGEAGCGIFYYDGTVNFTSHWPDSIAYIGDLDITGYRRPVSYLREIVFGLRKEPYLAVERLNHYGEVSSKTPWMLKDDIASWTWPGYEGKPGVINIFSDADEVELYLNGRLLERKGAGEGNGYIASFETLYEPGELKAVNYRNGIRAEEMVLETAGEPVKLAVWQERKEWLADGESLQFLAVSLIDEKGRYNLNAQRQVQVKVEGAAWIQGFGSADPQTENSYQNPVWQTYDGRLLLVLRAKIESGQVRVTFEMDEKETVLTLWTKNVLK